MKLTLFYGTDLASFAPHICLRKAEAVFDAVKLDKHSGVLSESWYLKLNPNARIPTLVVGDPEDGNSGGGNSGDGGFIVRESAAICLFVAEHFPDAGLLPAAGTADRARAMDSLIYLTNTVQADLMVWFYGHRYCDDDAQLDVIKGHAARRLGGMFATLDEQLAAQGPWLGGAAPGCADYFLYMVAGWAMQAGIPEPPSSRKHVLDHARRCEALPEVRDTMAAEGFTSHFG
ncbi:hypothetical protein HH303_06920 [Rhodospirillaceae bacterium KN72]|uniref:Glutathione S-transferase n=1 Tax=Pacificispira spongiicola TaxID=2729598 RepID=A0A7Y0DZ14_9PROT|nr:glutathione S-transferase C-terminal domain-containing protein [Pacificispira spongiicola]NMM44202.1 hypothetical protein [Pacificispira spongiicola]